MRRTPRTALTAVLAALGVSTALLATVAAQPTATAADTTAKPLKVVLLGDSYSAGNGARDANGDRDYYGPKDCYRSHSNWAEQYVTYLREEGYNVTFVNRVCSGSTTADLVDENKLDDRTGFVAASHAITT